MLVYELHSPAKVVVTTLYLLPAPLHSIPGLWSKYQKPLLVYKDESINQHFIVISIVCKHIMCIKLQHLTRTFTTILPQLNKIDERGKSQLVTWRWGQIFGVGRCQKSNNGGGVGVVGSLPQTSGIIIANICWSKTFSDIFCLNENNSI